MQTTTRQDLWTTCFYVWSVVSETEKRFLGTVQALGAFGAKTAAIEAFGAGHVLQIRASKYGRIILANTRKD